MSKRWVEKKARLEEEGSNKIDLLLESSEQKVDMHLLEEQIKRNNNHTETEPQREQLLLNIKGWMYELHYDTAMLAKDFIRIKCILMATASTKEMVSSPITFSIPKDFFTKNPVSLNIDLHLSRKLTRNESDILDEVLIHMRSFHKELFTTGNTSKESSRVDINAQVVRDDSPSESDPKESKEPITYHTPNDSPLWSVEGTYIGGQFHLPSKKWLTITEWIDNNITINDLIMPRYNVIQIRNAYGQITKARRNGKSYIALGGARKGLRPFVHNGDSFLNISDTHEVIVRATTPRDLSDKKTACFIFGSKWYTIDSLIAPNQGSIAIDYTNTSNPNGWVHQARRDATMWTYIDEYTNKKVLTYDGIQITLGSIVDLGLQIHLDEEDSSANSPRKKIDVVPLPDSKIAKVDVNEPSKDIEKEIGNIVATRPDQWLDYNITPEVTRNQFCEWLHAVESAGEKRKPYWYQAVNSSKGSTATGRYQFIYRIHKKEINSVTGTKTREEFLNSPKAQEEFMDKYRIPELKKWVAFVKKHSNGNYKKYSELELLALCHFLWAEWANDFLKTWHMKEKERKNNSSVENYLKKFNNWVAIAQQKSESRNDVVTK